MGANFNGALGGVNPNATPSGVNVNQFPVRGYDTTSEDDILGANRGSTMPFNQAIGQLQNMGGQQVNAQNPSFQAQNTGTTDAQQATQPAMNAGSPNYNQLVTNAYQQYLGRAPDQGGLQAWTQALQEGRITPDQLATNFRGSEEYQRLNPAGTQTQSRAYTTNPFGIYGQNATGLQASTDPYVQAAQQTALGNLAGAQNATAANRINQQTPYANLQYTQTGTDANGNPIWSATQTLNPTLQSAMSGLQNRLASTAGQGINTSTLAQTGINPGELYSDAIMRRLQPQLQQQQASVETRLANQGIMPGSEAYNRAKTQLAQQQNDLLTAAQVQGMDVGLRANQQGFNQQLQQSNLPIQQLGAFNQATQPGYVTPYNQAAVAGPDYLGSYTTAQAARIAAQNAANARTANLQSGLFGLGSSALLGGGGLSGLANLGQQGYNWLTGLGQNSNIIPTGDMSLFGANSIPIDTGINDLIGL